jgi:hypothetical protein
MPTPIASKNAEKNKINNDMGYEKFLFITFFPFFWCISLFFLFFFGEKTT